MNMKLPNWLKALKPKKVVQELILLDNGFQINNREVKSNVIWADITEINAYKRDLITEDQICLEISSGSNQFYCTEDFDGWKEFEEMMRKQFPEIETHWLMQTANPALETSKTQIYTTNSFLCSVCGEIHNEWPALTFYSPHAYHDLNTKEKETIATLDSDFCKIEHGDQIDRFIRVVLNQKVKDSKQDLNYGLWVSLSEKSYENYLENFNNINHEEEYFGWLNNSIAEYSDTTIIPTTIVTKKGDERPEIFPHEDFEHKFVQDYYAGISKEEAEKRIHDMMQNAG